MNGAGRRGAKVFVERHAQLDLLRGLVIGIDWSLLAEVDLDLLADDRGLGDAGGFDLDLDLDWLRNVEHAMLLILGLLLDDRHLILKRDHWL